MEYLQYYKGDVGFEYFLDVLNLIINGIPSIQKRFRMSAVERWEF